MCLFLVHGSYDLLGFLEWSVAQELLRTIARTHTAGLNKQMDRSTPGLKILQSPGCGDSLALQSHAVFVSLPILCLHFILVCATSAGPGLAGTGVTKKALHVGGVGAAHREARGGQVGTEKVSATATSGRTVKWRVQKAWDLRRLSFELGFSQSIPRPLSQPIPVLFRFKWGFQGSHPQTCMLAPMCPSHPRAHLPMSASFPLCSTSPGLQGWLLTQSPHFYHTCPHSFFQLKMAFWFCSHSLSWDPHNRRPWTRTSEKECLLANFSGRVRVVAWAPGSQDIWAPLIWVLLVIF